MNKIEIEVPSNIRYISEWTDFDINLLTGHSIFNKTITGCGFTHYCLTDSPFPTILCSPRKFLLENKKNQLLHCHLVINKGEKSLDVDGEPVKRNVLKHSQNPGNLTQDDFNDFQQLENFEEISELKRSLLLYMTNCKITSQVPRILVTYDSLKHVLNFLNDEGYNISQFSVIVDEFQNIFIDSRFKAETELNLIKTLQFCPNVTYLSATPYIEEYLDELDEFKDLPYYELKWDPNKLRKINLIKKKVSNPIREVDKIIISFLNDLKQGKYYTKVTYDSNGNPIINESREVVFYVNSVRSICSIIKRLNLSPDQVNIICSNDAKNLRKLQEIDKKFTIGVAPMFGEPHKPITFCTRTVYAGADFYSTNARTFIISDCKIDSLMIDIRMDFPQIMGRQRLKENVFRDECIFIYKLSDSEVTEEEFIKLSNEKIKETDIDLKSYNRLKTDEDDGCANKFVSTVRRRIRSDKYSFDYTGIDESTGEPVFNKLVYISEKRAFEIRSNDYKSEFSVYNEFSDITNDIISSDLEIQMITAIDGVKELFKLAGPYHYKMKYVCDLLTQFPDIHPDDKSLSFLTDHFRNPIKYLGIERIKALGYRESSLLQEMSDLKKSGVDSFILGIKNEFKIGYKYTRKNVKERLSDLYSIYSINKTPKATDIENYFRVKECLISIDGKRISGYEILEAKE